MWVYLELILILWLFVIGPFLALSLRRVRQSLSVTVLWSMSLCLYLGWLLGRPA